MSGNEASPKADAFRTGAGTGVHKAVMLTTIAGVIAMAAGGFLWGLVPPPPIFSGVMKTGPRPLGPAAAALITGDAWICSAIGMRREYLWCELIALICALLIGILGLDICLEHGSPAGYLLLSLAVAEGFALTAYRVALNDDRKPRLNLSNGGCLSRPGGRMS